MLTLKSHCKKYFTNSFSQILLTNVFAKIKKIFDTIFTIEVEWKRFLKTINEHNVYN
jgi:hypothetical protein